MAKPRYLPYGYRIQNGLITPDTAQAECVRQIYQLYLAGNSLQEIAKRLQATGIPYSDETGWNKNTVHRIVKNPAYTGRDSYPPIVEEALFQKAQVLCQRKAPTYTETLRDIRGDIICPDCDSRLEWQTKGHRWRCRHCAAFSVQIAPDILLQSIATTMKRLQDNPDSINDQPLSHNTVSIVEQHGILVTSISTNTNDVDAFSQFMQTGDVPTFIIAYSNNKTSAVRIHFDIAHELGHICLHEWSEDIEDVSKEEFKRKEREANDFAAAFLLPEETFRRDAERGPQTITYYKQLKKKWKVSIAAMIRRSEKLGIITTDDYQNLIRIMQRRGLRKEEPLDDTLITASPALLKTSVIMLLQENVFTPAEFMEELSDSYGLSINATEVERLLDLPVGTLAAHKIIKLPNLQLKRNAT